MQALSVGSHLQTEFGKDLCVVRKLGEGGQGIVYEVECDGAHKALKWYYPSSIANKDKFMDNLRNNILKGAPAEGFLWPQDMAVSTNGSFGYVMDLRPKGYYEASEILLKPSLLFSFKRLVDACLNIVVAFRGLHDKGYCYQDINDGNFFIEPGTGKVLVCDNDNVAPEGTDTGVLGHPDFMAPEIVTGQSMPTVRTDLHSLAVLIFYLLVFQHPLVGVRGVVRDQETSLRIFGTDPVFIFDPKDGSNPPMRHEDNNALRIWGCLPWHMQDVFCEAFSKDALHNPNRRLNEQRWIQELVRFRSEIVTCSCGNEVFLQGVGPRRCESCGKIIAAPLRVDLVAEGGRVTPLVPVVPDARIYTCQINHSCDTSEALDPLMWMLPSKRDAASIGLGNVSKEDIVVRFGNQTRSLPPKAAIHALEGVMLRVPNMRKNEFLRIGKNVWEREG